MCCSDPGPNTTDMVKVTATAEWKFDVKHGHIRFEDNRYHDLAASYGMRGEELSVFFAEHPEDYEAAVRRSRRVYTGGYKHECILNVVDNSSVHT